MHGDVLAFLIPAMDPLQLVFFCLIFGGVLLTVMLLRKNANAASWERNWSDGGLGDNSDKLDADHGSVSDLSHAVATNAEKMAEAMPGILLILGLLGTFLGLGLALDSASNILKNSGVGASGMNHAMGDLMGMMGGLGTKFKTSTWGIIGFLILKLCASRMGVEEKRLRWCVGKMKLQFTAMRKTQDDERKKLQDDTRQDNRRLVTAIENMGTTLGALFGREMLANRELLKQACTHGEHRNTLLQDMAESLDTQVGKSIEIAASNAAISHELLSFVEANNANMQAMASSSGKMADAAVAVGQSAKRLEIAIDGFSSKVGQVLDGVKQDLAVTINAMNDNFGTRLKEMETSLTSVTGDISDAVKELSVRVGQTLGSLEQQLGGTIRTMNDSFSSNITSMSSDLKGATNNIAEAVKLSSDSVSDTMSKMKSAIEASVKVQIKAGSEFSAISMALEEKVTEMTSLVRKLGDDIQSGLRAVSNSSQEVKSLNGRYASITAAIEEMVEALREILAAQQVALRHAEAVLDDSVAA